MPSAPSEIPRIQEEDLPKVPILLNDISTRFIRENKIVPLEWKNNVLKVLMVNPYDREAIDALRVAVSGEVVIYTADAKGAQQGYGIRAIVTIEGSTGYRYVYYKSPARVEP